MLPSRTTLRQSGAAGVLGRQKVCRTSLRTALLAPAAVLPRLVLQVEAPAGNRSPAASPVDKHLTRTKSRMLALRHNSSLHMGFRSVATHCGSGVVSRQESSSLAPSSPTHAREWLCIAVDGPAAAGKGTLSRALAQRFKCRYLDTGILYRAVGWRALREGVSLNDQPALAIISSSLTPSDTAHPQLRSDEAASAASQVSVLPAVRAMLLEYQRTFSTAEISGFRGAVLDGRDIGSTVCPGAHVKLFVTASPEVRARRRWSELQSKEGAVHQEYAHVLEELQARDARDSSRTEAPLRATMDALILDTSCIDEAGVLAAAVAHVHASCPWLDNSG